ncbi:MAG: hypothetical protein MI861_06705 [Pirellulales bacterium]|nr:hypothetical protein [Pirellulales bacterium]
MNETNRSAPYFPDKDHPLVLSDDRIIETIAVLQRRISERFPESGLSRLCGKLLDVSRQASDRAAWISRPILWIRVLGYLFACALISVLIGIVVHAVRTSQFDKLTFFDFIQILESGLNDVIFIAAAIYFLVSLETRIKRRRALAAVHELRSIAHIVDMHQLTKDPERVLKNWARTEHSPKQRMTPFQLNRYLDYCSEMLALIGKVASLYVQKFDDAASVAAVSELEQLSTGLSRKIWQKIIATRSLNPADTISDTRQDAGQPIDDPPPRHPESSPSSPSSAGKES